jgi:S-adenosylmethionine hydrolase
VIDLAHNVRSQSLVEAALDLEATIGYFPEPTVFCCVVDPGVGTERAAIVASDRRHYYVAPDNGVLSLVETIAKEEGRSWHVRTLDASRVSPEREPSATFHGRDLFAPAAADIARGGLDAFRSIGTRVETWARLDVPEPEFDSRRGEVRLEILASDPFGNLFTTLRRSTWDRYWEKREKEGEGPRPAPGTCIVRIGQEELPGLVRTFAEVEPGEPLGYWGSGGRLEIAVREGNAADRFSVVQGASVTLRWPVEPGPTG